MEARGSLSGVAQRPAGAGPQATRIRPVVLFGGKTALGLRVCHLWRDKWTALSGPLRHGLGDVQLAAVLSRLAAQARARLLQLGPSGSRLWCLEI